LNFRLTPPWLFFSGLHSFKHCSGSAGFTSAL
jgi:hypothetical protein